MTVNKLICALIVLINCLSTWNIAQALSLDGNCSHWKMGTLTDSSGINREAEAKAICANLGKSGDAITVFDPRNQTCLLCARDDWTPGSPSSPSSPSGNNGTEGKVASGDHTSSKIKCHLYSGYMFSSKPGAEFNVLQSIKPNSMGYTEFLYTVAPPPTKRFNHIERARKEARRVMNEGARGNQYRFAFRGSPGEFCNFIESQCDMKKSSVNVARKGCGWSK